jgi:hypothetical protein
MTTVDNKNLAPQRLKKKKERQTKKKKNLQLET